MTKELDKDTQKIQQEGEKANGLMRGENWEWAKRKLLQKLSNIDNVKTLDLKKDLKQQIEVRKMVIDMILEWISDIEGINQQHSEQSPRKLLEKVEEDDYILNTEEE